MNSNVAMTCVCEKKHTRTHTKKKTEGKKVRYSKRNKVRINMSSEFLLLLAKWNVLWLHD